MNSLPQKPKNLARFEAEKTYHIFNRTNNKEVLFREEQDYLFFLDRYRKYLEHYVDTFCYSLPINHFHNMLRVKNEMEIYEHLKSLCQQDLTLSQKQFLEAPAQQRDMHHLIKGQMLRFFTSYAMYYNKKYRRKGNLFYRPFKRVEINNDVHFSHLVYYIHANPAKHGICEDFTSFAWSSYQTLLNDSPTFLKRDELLEWFGGRKEFLEYHHTAQDIFLNRNVHLEL